MLLVPNETPWMIIRIAIILSTVNHLASAFDQCDVRGRFVSAKGKLILGIDITSKYESFFYSHEISLLNICFYCCLSFLKNVRIDYPMQNAIIMPS